MTTSIIGGISRLTDPDGVAKDARQLADLKEKISSCMTRLYRLPENGGNPFLFALAGPKPHFLARTIGSTNFPIKTAATDGKRFYWNPDFLARLTEDEVSVVMSHESFHVLFFHCDLSRSAGKNPEDWNIAVDYIVNGVIEHNHTKIQSKGGKQLFKLWGGNLGEPLPLQTLLDYFAAKVDALPEGTSCFADPTLYGRSPESIYDDIQNGKLKSPRRCKETSGGCGALSIDPKTGKSIFEGDRPVAGSPTLPKEGEPWGPGSCPKCGAPPHPLLDSMDSHMPSDCTKDEVMGDMMRAAEQASQMRGTVPSEVEAALGELKKPTLRARDIIKHAFQRKQRDMGNKNDWKRLRRRQLAMNPRQFLPKKHDHSPKYLVLLDTSGSMSDHDVANGLKEMQAVADNAEGWVIPCDAMPYWDQKTRITRQSDVKRTKVVGRGGTVFDEFFRDYPVKMGTAWDIVIIITDGDCGNIPMNLKPHATDILWVITNKREFHPTFGRVVQLNPVKHLQTISN